MVLQIEKGLTLFFENPENLYLFGNRTGIFVFCPRRFINKFSVCMFGMNREFKTTVLKINELHTSNCSLINNSI